MSQNNEQGAKAIIFEARRKGGETAHTLEHVSTFNEDVAHL